MPISGCSLAHDPIVDTTLKVYGVSAVPDQADPEQGHLVIITEAGIMNALQLYQEEEVPLFVTLDLWRQLAAATHMMHSKHILHHDLKPENVLITGVREDSGNNRNEEMFLCNLSNIVLAGQEIS